MVESDFIVVGVEPNPGGPPFALLARETETGLVYAGSAFVTLPQAERDRFWIAATELTTSKPALKDIRKRDVAFVKPTLHVKAKHLRGVGMLRHASLSKLLF